MKTLGMRGAFGRWALVLPTSPPIDAGFDLAVPVDAKVPFAQEQAVYECLRNAERVLGED